MSKIPRKSYFRHIPAAPAPLNTVGIPRGNELFSNKLLRSVRAGLFLLLGILVLVWWTGSFFSFVPPGQIVWISDFLSRTGLNVVWAVLLCFFTGYLCLYVKDLTDKEGIAFDQHGIGIGKTIEEIRATSYPWFQLKKVQLRRMFALPFPELVLVVETNYEGNAIKWKHVCDSVDPIELLSAIRHYAPNARLDFSLLEDRKVSNASYTKLWFKYHTIASDRRRTTELQAGDSLQDGRYAVAGRIGSGGQGTAYLAVDENDDSQSEVVLKEYILPLHRGDTAFSAQAEKLDAEALLLSGIDHPQIVKLKNYFVEDYRGYLVLEYVEGKTLKEIVESEGPQPESIVRNIAMQACEILSYLHSLSPPVVHRDVTPDNFIMQVDGCIKLVDFNVAHQLESERTATIVGKQRYIPPEQFRGRPTIQSDLYALGCTLHFLLTAQEPEPISISHPREIKSTVSEALDAVVAKCTAIDIKLRFENISEVSKALISS